MAPSKTAASTKAKGAPTKTKTPAARKLKHQHDPDTIRIVPLHVAGDAEHPTPEALAAGPAAAPHLTYRGGPLLTSVKVFTISGAPRGLARKPPWLQKSTPSLTTS
jgi:hypothetical protein